MNILNRKLEDSTSKFTEQQVRKEHNIEHMYIYTLYMYINYMHCVCVYVHVHVHVHGLSL